MSGATAPAWAGGPLKVESGDTETIQYGERLIDEDSYVRSGGTLIVKESDNFLIPNGAILLKGYKVVTDETGISVVGIEFDISGVAHILDGGRFVTNRTAGLATVINTGEFSVFSGGLVENGSIFQNEGDGEIHVEGGDFENGFTLTNKDDAKIVINSGRLINDGTLTNESTIENNASLRNFGTLNNNLGASLNVNDTLSNFIGATLNNDQGNVSVTAELVNLGGVLKNKGSSGIDIYEDGTLANNGQFNNDGSVTVRSGGTLNNEKGVIFLPLAPTVPVEIAADAVLNNADNLDVFGTLNNGDRATLNNNSGGKLRIYSDGVLFNFDGAILNNRLGAEIVNAGLIEHYDGAINNEGNLTNFGSLNNYAAVTNFSTGVIDIEQNGAFQNKTDASLLNNGTINLNDEVDAYQRTAVLANHGDFTNTGTVNNKSGQLTNTSVLVNENDIENTGSSQLLNRGELTNNGNLFVGDGSELRNDGFTTGVNKGTLDNNGFLAIESGGTLFNNYSGELNNSGSLTVGGSLENLGTLTNFDKILNQSGGSIVNQGAMTVLLGTFVNAGSFSNFEALDFNGGVAFNQGTFANFGRVTATSSGDIKNELGTLTNFTNGLMDFQSSSGLANSATLNNQGSLLFEIGSSLSNAGGTLNNDGVIGLSIDFSMDDSGTVNLNAGGTINVFNTLTNATGHAQANNGIINIGKTKQVDTGFGIITTYSGGRFENRGTFDNNFGAQINVDNQLSSLVNYSELNNYGLIAVKQNAALRNRGVLSNMGNLTLAAGATFDNINGALNNAGSLYTDSASILDNTGGKINNAGVISLRTDLQLGSTVAGTINLFAGGSLITFAGLTNQAGHTQDNSGAIHNYGTLANHFTATLNNGGTLTNYAGASLKNFGTLNNSGALNIKSASIIDNTGGTINNNFGGHINLEVALPSGGAFGTINLNNGSTLDAFVALHNGSGNSNNDTLVSDFNLSAGSTINVHAGFTNKGTFDNAAVLGLIGGQFDNTSGIFNNNAGGVVNLNVAVALGGASAGLINLNAGGTLNSTFVLTNVSGHLQNNFGTLNNHGEFTNQATATFTSRRFSPTSTFAALTNYADGTIENDGAFNILQTTTLTNAGELNNNDGAVFESSGHIINSRTLNNNSGAELGLSRVSGISPQLTGLFENRNGGMLNNAGNLFARNGTVLSNAGTINNDAGGLLEFQSGARFDNTRFLNNAGRLNLQNGVQFNNQGGTINNNNGGVIDLGVDLTLSSGTLNLNTGSTLNNGRQLRNISGHIQNNFGTLNNNSGALLSNTNNATFNNDGTLNNKAGALLSNTNGATFNNHGTLNNNGGASLSNTNNATFNNYGDITNNGGLENAATFNLIGAAELAHYTGSLLNAGTMNVSGTSQIFNFGTFHNTGIVAYHEGTSSFTNDGTLTNDGRFDSGTFSSSIVNQGTGVMDNHGDLILGGSASVLNQSIINNYADGTVEIGTDNFNNVGTITNAGQFTARTGSKIIQIGQISNVGEFVIRAGAQITNEAFPGFSFGGTYTQFAGTTTVNGLLQQSSIDIQGGILKGIGDIIGNVNIGSGATFAPGNSPGTLNIAGDLLIDGILELETFGGVSDLINVTGNLTFGASAMVNLFYDVLPTDPIVFEDFFAPDSFAFEPGFDIDNLSLFTVDEGLDGLMVSVLLGGESYQLTTVFNLPENFDPNAAPVPVRRWDRNFQAS